MEYTSHSDTPISYRVKSPFLKKKKKSVLKSAFSVTYLENAATAPLADYRQFGNAHHAIHPSSGKTVLTLYKGPASHLLVLT